MAGSPFGQHLILGISGTELNDDDKRILSELKPIGAIFFGKNFRHGLPYEVWLQSFKELMSQVRQYAERESMFMTLDHEGVSVLRTPLPMTRFPHACLLLKHSQAVAQATAVELKSLGINVSWAPVADIFSNPQNPVIGPRAFGYTPETTAEYVCNYYMGLKESGILGSAKHFPGHGDTNQDSHLELPILNLTVEDLRLRELIPFQALIALQVPIIMTAHILFPKIDAVPATLSQKILQNLLRQELGFKGVIVSDDLDMQAVSQMFAQKGTVAQAFNAGCDLLIVSRNLPASNLERIRLIAADFTDSLAQGSLAESVVAQSQSRITQLLATTPQYPVIMLNPETFEQHAKLAIACSFS